jgi:hypothetical protein
MKRAWQRQHIRLTVVVVQTDLTRFEIPLNASLGTKISIDGSLEEAQRIGDAVSGCGPLCTCPAWEDCNVHREKREMPHVEDTSLPQVSWPTS